MNINYIYEVLSKYLKARYSSNTEKVVQSWLLDDKHKKEKEQYLEEFWNTIESSEQTQPSVEAYTALNTVNKKIGFKSTKRLSLFNKISQVAAVLIPLLILAGGYYYYNNNTSNQFYEFVTKDGEQKQIILPDGSEVWLNSQTKLVFEENTREKKRNLQLSGEAYFKVKKDKERPFVVQSDHILVTVLGTEFNLKDYPSDNKSIATLNTGHIQILTNDSRVYTMLPNEEFVYNNKTKETKLYKISVNEASSWKDGYIEFNNTPLNEILQVISRQHKVTVVLQQGYKPTNDTYSLRFKNSTSLSEVLSVIGDIAGFTYTIEGNKVILKTK